MNYKELGNKAKQNGDIEGAINNYTMAIQEDNNQSIYYSNRAICYKELGQIQNAMNDAQSAIEIDEKNIKAQFIMAGCQLIRGQNEANVAMVEKGEKRLRHAHSMCRAQKKDDFEKQIQVNIYRARKLIFILKEKERLAKLEEFYTVSSNKIKNDNSLDNKGKERKQALLDKYIDRDRYNYEIPEYYICEISGGLMMDPMITKYGHTYDKSSILSYINTYMKDPKENKPLSAGEVYPNLAMRDAMESFLKENGWAYEFKDKNTLFNSKIEF
jgi:STIP1 family protein 1